MNTIEFESLDINAKVKYLNAKLKEGNTVIRIREDMGISEKYLQREIKKGGFKYNQKLRQYLPSTETTTTSTTQSIVVNLVDDKHLSPKPKSIRINEFVYRDWQKFCEDNKYHSKQELISMALKEYMKNHSK